jgi:hypothetical protein
MNSLVGVLNLRVGDHLGHAAIAEHPRVAVVDVEHLVAVADDDPLLRAFHHLAHLRRVHPRLERVVEHELNVEAPAWTKAERHH